jgi:UDP-MurNAc hydroxylase
VQVDEATLTIWLNRRLAAICSTGKKMKRNVLTFVNHACFTVQNQTALLLVDPWLEGPAFNHGWSLLDQSTSSAALVARLNRAGVPVYIWYSREQPDHFSLSFIKRFKEDFRGIATFLFQHTLDKRVTGLLRRSGLEVIECAHGVPVALGHDMRITVFPDGEGGSWSVINSGGRIILNLNDCAPATPDQCQVFRLQAAKAAPRIDLMLTQFGYAGWVGNPDQLALRKAAANEQVNRIALQIKHLKPRITVPFASFVYFSNPENAYLNEGQNTPQAIVEAPQLAKVAGAIRFLQPGSEVDLDNDTAASLAPAHEQAVAHWMGLVKAGFGLLPGQPAGSLAEVKSAFMKYRATAAASLHGLPRLLETTRCVTPLVIHLADLQQTVRLSYRTGFKVLDRNAPYHVAMSSANAIFLFRNEHGFDTAHANGRFRTGQPGALSAFSRFFLPQRMGRNGYDRRHPLVTGRYLVRNALARAARQLQAALRKLSNAA